MRQRTLRSVSVLASAVLALAGVSAATTASAGGKKDRAGLSGVWVQTGGEVKIAFSDRDVMKIFPHGENEVIVVVCNYTLDKGGQVKARIAQFEGKEEAKQHAKEKLPVGLEFRFQWTVKGTAATLGDLMGDKVELLKAHLEGKYDLKK